MQFFDVPSVEKWVKENEAHPHFTDVCDDLAALRVLDQKCHHHERSVVDSIIALQTYNPLEAEIVIHRAHISFIETHNRRPESDKELFEFINDLDSSVPKEPVDPMKLSILSHTLQLPAEMITQAWTGAGFCKHDLKILIEMYPYFEAINNYINGKNAR